MKLDRVTITGADGSVDPAALADLSAEFPFVEWGILVSRPLEGAARFPDRTWVTQLLATAPPDVRLSLHLCGRWVRDLMVGKDYVVSQWGSVDRFQRMQLNFHAERHDVYLAQAVMVLRRVLGDHQVIVQMDDRNNELLEVFRKEGLDCVPLFDTSAGAGIVPATWPRPIPDVPYHGYAGGLGPETLEHELERIAEAAGDARIWIDMERRVRSEDDQKLDLDKVRRCLEICAPRIAG